MKIKLKNLLEGVVNPPSVMDAVAGNSGGKDKDKNKNNNTDKQGVSEPEPPPGLVPNPEPVPPAPGEPPPGLVPNPEPQPPAPGEPPPGLVPNPEPEPPKPEPTPEPPKPEPTPEPPKPPVKPKVKGYGKAKTPEELEGERKAKRDARLNRMRERAEENELKRSEELAAARHSARLARMNRSSRGIFEQTLRFRPNSLKSLLESVTLNEKLLDTDQESGIVTPSGSVSAMKAEDPARFKKIESDKWTQNNKYIEGFKDVVGKIKDTAAEALDVSLNPKKAAETYSRMTKPVPGEDTTNFFRMLAATSPETMAKIRSGRVAQAAIFDPSGIGAEQMKHYKNILDLTNPLGIAVDAATGVIGNIGANLLGNKESGGVAKTVGAALSGTAGLAGKVANNYLDQMNTEAARRLMMMKKDLRYGMI
jgi:hypothetical protein